MGSPDLWSKIKGTFQVSITNIAGGTRFRLTDHRLDNSGDLWRPWDAVAIDNQANSQVIHARFGGEPALGTLATGPADEDETDFRIYPRTRQFFARAATSVNLISESAATTVFIDVYKF